MNGRSAITHAYWIAPVATPASAAVAAIALKAAATT
jgi:hypothetical protein